MYISGPSGGGVDFRHPFLVTAGAKEARVAAGLILANIAVQPLIGSVPIGGDDKRQQPVLRLDASLINEANESWVCVEATPDAEGNLDEKGEASKVEVVQSRHPIADVGPTGRTPLALLVRRGTGWQVFQIAMFHLRYVTSQPANGPRRHFFL